MGQRDFKVIIFKDGKRRQERYDGIHLDEQVQHVRDLRADGTRATIVFSNITRYARGFFPPKDQIADNRQQGLLWCPYCRTWRYFKVPKYHLQGGEVGSRVWWMNACNQARVPVCAWCEISIYDYYVGVANNIHAEVRAARTRRRTRKRVRR
jgi:hypothetical protein